MDAQKLLNILNHARNADWTIRFDDGDEYALANLDIHQECPDPHGEIDVAFADCCGRSNAEQSAIAADNHRVPNIWYDAEKPVGKTYCVDQVESIFDDATNYFVFDRNNST